MDRLLSGPFFLWVLAAVPLLALGAVSATSVVRALGFMKPLLARGAKPWSCDVCMAAWSQPVGLLLSASGFLAGEQTGLRAMAAVAVAALPAHGLAVLLLARLRPPPLFAEEERSHDDLPERDAPGRR